MHRQQKVVLSCLGLLTATDEHIDSCLNYQNVCIEERLKEEVPFPPIAVV